MLINKRQFRINNDKKVLRKKGKRWIVVSALMLGMLGGAGVVSAQSTHASSIQAQPKTTAVQPQSMNTKQIGSRASNLHDALMANAPTSSKSPSSISSQSASSRVSSVSSSSSAQNGSVSQNKGNRGSSVASASSNAEVGSYVGSVNSSLASNSPKISSAVNGKAGQSASAVSSSAQSGISRTSMNSIPSNTVKSGSQSSVAHSSVTSNSTKKPMLGATNLRDNATVYSGYWNKGIPSAKFTIDKNGHMTISDGTINGLVNTTSSGKAEWDSPSGYGPRTFGYNWDNGEMGLPSDKKNLVKTISFHNVSIGKSATDLFANFHNLTSIDLSGVDSSKTTSILGMFSRDGSLRNLDMSPLDLSNVTSSTGGETAPEGFLDSDDLENLDISSLRPKANNHGYFSTGTLGSNLSVINVKVAKGFPLFNILDFHGTGVGNFWQNNTFGPASGSAYGVVDANDNDALPELKNATEPAGWYYTTTIMNVAVVARNKGLSGEYESQLNTKAPILPNKEFKWTASLPFLQNIENTFNYGSNNYKGKNIFADFPAPDVHSAYSPQDIDRDTSDYEYFQMTPVTYVNGKYTNVSIENNQNVIQGMPSNYNGYTPNYSRTIVFYGNYRNLQGTAPVIYKYNGKTIYSHTYTGIRGSHVPSSDIPLYLKSVKVPEELSGYEAKNYQIGGAYAEYKRYDSYTPMDTTNPEFKRTPTPLIINLRKIPTTINGGNDSVKYVYNGKVIYDTTDKKAFNDYKTSDSYSDESDSNYSDFTSNFHGFRNINNPAYSDDGITISDSDGNKTYVENNDPKEYPVPKNLPLVASSDNIPSQLKGYTIVSAINTVRDGDNDTGSGLILYLKKVPYDTVTYTFHGKTVGSKTFVPFVEPDKPIPSDFNIVSDIGGDINSYKRDELMPSDISDGENWPGEPNGYFVPYKVATSLKLNNDYGQNHLVIPVEKSEASDTVIYAYNSSNDSDEPYKTIYSYKLSGNANRKVSLKSDDSKIISDDGFTIPNNNSNNSDSDNSDNSDNESDSDANQLTLNGSKKIIMVTPQRQHDTITFTYNGQTMSDDDIGNLSDSGNDYRTAKYGVSDTSVEISPENVGKFGDDTNSYISDAGYMIAKPYQTVPFDGNNHNIPLAKLPNVTETFNYVDPTTGKIVYIGHTTGTRNTAINTSDDETSDSDISDNPNVSASASVPTGLPMLYGHNVPAQLKGYAYLGTNVKKYGSKVQQAQSDIVNGVTMTYDGKSHNIYIIKPTMPNASNTINFICNGHIVSSKTFTGRQGSSDTNIRNVIAFTRKGITSPYLPSGYSIPYDSSLINLKTHGKNYDNSVINIPVNRVISQATATAEYVGSDGSIIGQPVTLTGTQNSSTNGQLLADMQNEVPVKITAQNISQFPGLPKSMIGQNILMSSGWKNLPQGYKVTNEAQAMTELEQATFNNSTVQIMINKPVTKSSAVVDYVYDGKTVGSFSEQGTSGQTAYAVSSDIAVMNDDGDITKYNGLPKGYALTPQGKTEMSNITMGNTVPVYGGKALIVQVTKPLPPITSRTVIFKGMLDLHFTDANGKTTKDIYLPYSINTKMNQVIRDILNDTNPSAVVPTDYLNKVIDKFSTSNYTYTNNVNRAEYDNVTVDPKANGWSNIKSNNPVFTNGTITMNFKPKSVAINGTAHLHVIYKETNGTVDSSDNINIPIHQHVGDSDMDVDPWDYEKDNYSDSNSDWYIPMDKADDNVNVYHTFTYTGVTADTLTVKYVDVDPDAKRMCNETVDKNGRPIVGVQQLNNLGIVGQNITLGAIHSNDGKGVLDVLQVPKGFMLKHKLNPFTMTLTDKPMSLTMYFVPTPAMKKHRQAVAKGATDTIQYTYDGKVISSKQFHGKTDETDMAVINLVTNTDVDSLPNVPQGYKADYDSVQAIKATDDKFMANNPDYHFNGTTFSIPLAKVAKQPSKPVAPVKPSTRPASAKSSAVTKQSASVKPVSSSATSVSAKSVASSSAKSAKSLAPVKPFGSSAKSSSAKSAEPSVASSAVSTKSSATSQSAKSSATSTSAKQSVASASASASSVQSAVSSSASSAKSVASSSAVQSSSVSSSVASSSADDNASYIAPLSSMTNDYPVPSNSDDNKVFFASDNIQQPTKVARKHIARKHAKRYAVHDLLHIHKMSYKHNYAYMAHNKRIATVRRLHIGKRLARKHIVYGVRFTYKHHSYFIYEVRKHGKEHFISKRVRHHVSLRTLLKMRKRLYRELRRDMRAFRREHR